MLGDAIVPHMAPPTPERPRMPMQSGRTLLPLRLPAYHENAVPVKAVTPNKRQPKALDTCQKRSMIMTASLATLSKPSGERGWDDLRAVRWDDWADFAEFEGDLIRGGQARGSTPWSVA